MKQRREKKNQCLVGLFLGSEKPARGEIAIDIQALNPNPNPKWRQERLKTLLESHFRVVPAFFVGKLKEAPQKRKSNHERMAFKMLPLVKMLDVPPILPPSSTVCLNFQPQWNATNISTHAYSLKNRPKRQLTKYRPRLSPYLRTNTLYKTILAKLSFGWTRTRAEKKNVSCIIIILSNFCSS